MMVYMVLCTPVTYSYACSNIVNTIKTSGQFFRKIYLSPYSKGLRKGYRVKSESETEQNCNILTPRSPGLLNRGPGGQPLLGLVLTPRTGTLTSLSNLQLPDFLSHPGYIIV